MDTICKSAYYEIDFEDSQLDDAELAECIEAYNKAKQECCKKPVYKHAHFLGGMI